MPPSHWGTSQTLCTRSRLIWQKLIFLEFAEDLGMTGTERRWGLGAPSGWPGRGEPPPSSVRWPGMGGPRTQGREPAGGEETVPAAGDPGFWLQFDNLGVGGCVGRRGCLWGPLGTVPERG